MTSQPDWTDEQLDRFTAAEICIDELLQINDEFPGFFTAAQYEALWALRRGPFDGFGEEPIWSRQARLKAVRDRLQAAFPVKHRTHAERIMKEPSSTTSSETS